MCVCVWLVVPVLAWFVWRRQVVNWVSDPKAGMIGPCGRHVQPLSIGPQMSCRGRATVPTVSFSPRTHQRYHGNGNKVNCALNRAFTAQGMA